jgi:acyl-CoA synthetase (AMP-forming)/AMP-acid ligase II/thioesterase domain-containing protein
LRTAEALPDDTDIATLGDAIFQHARLRADTPALIAPGGETTDYAALANGVRAFSEALTGLGIPQGSVLCLMIQHSIEAALASAMVSVHGILVPLNPNAAVTEHEATMTRLRPCAILTDDTCAEQALALAAAHGLDAIHVGSARNGALPVRRIREGRAQPSLMPPDVAHVLRSSGTTGAPKFIPVTHQNLIAMTRTLMRAVGVSASDRGACATPLYLAMGLQQTLCVPLLLGASAAIPDPAERSRPDLWSSRLNPTWLTSSPASLQDLVDAMARPGAGAISESVRFNLCGSSPVPERLRAEAETVLGVPVLAAYGLSEAGLVACMPPSGPKTPGSVGKPIPGELLILGREGKPAPAGAEGDIALSGPCLTPGYLSDDGGIEPRPQWLLTGDIGRVDADGVLTITGRSKEMINRGGEKISPYEIEAALLAHPDVLEAAAFPIPHPRLGEIASAAVVLQPRATLPEDGYRAFLSRSLSRAKLPDPVIQLEALPRSGAGKVLRRELAARHGHIATQPVPPDGLLELQIHAVWARTLGRDDVGVEEDFFAAGGDSLMSANVAVEIESLIGRPVPTLESDRPMTVREIARLIMEEPVERGPIQEPKEKTGAPPFFFCHGDYLNHGFYARHLADLTDGERQMYLVAPPIDAMMHGPVPNPVLARDYIPRLLELQPKGPFVLGGYCNGGIFAWELARQLIAHGREVQALIMVDTPTLNLRPQMRSAKLIARIAGVLAAPFGQARKAQGLLMLAAWQGITNGRKNTLLELWRHYTDPGSDTLFGAPSRIRHAFYPLGVYTPRPLPVPVYCITCETSEQRADFDPERWSQVAGSVKRWTIPGEHWTCITVHVDRLAGAMVDAFKDIRSGAHAPEPTRPAAPRAARLVQGLLPPPAGR